MKLSPTTPATQADSLTTLALQIAAGDLSGLPRTDTPIFEIADWQSAADELLHECNPFELDFMLARQGAADRFDRWQRADERGREFACFDAWLDDMATWNGPDSLYARGRRMR